MRILKAELRVIAAAVGIIMATTALPSLQECTSILSSLLNTSNSNNNEDTESLTKWRLIIQNCLSHGTTSTPQDDDTDTNVVTQRAEEAGNLLCNSLEWYLGQWYQKQTSSKDEKSGDTSEVETSDYEKVIDKLKNDPVICAVVEALWLKGCLLEPTNPETTPAAVVTSASTDKEGDKDDDKEKGEVKKLSYDNLLQIIQCLVTPKPWMGGSTEEDDDANMEDAATEDKDEDTTTPSKNVKKLHPLIPISILQTTLEISLLQDANLLPDVPPSTSAAAKRPPDKGKGKATPAEPDTSKDVITKKLKKINTDLYYRQHKFNLLAEESEGYSKLLTFLILGIKDNKHSGGNEEDKMKYIQELIGAFDLDPNRVLDLVLDILEWELNDLVKSTTTGGKNSSNNKQDNGVEWWGIDQIRTAIMSSCKDNKMTNVIHSLLSIIRKLDGNDTNGRYEGRAVAHLLGFKYRSYYAMSASAAAAKAKTDKDGKASTSTPEKSRNIYPRSLYLSTAFLCAHGILDVHALIPHLVSTATAIKAAASSSSSTTKSTTAAATSATTLMQSYQTYCTDTVKRLKKMGVVSLNSKSDKKDDETTDEDILGKYEESMRLDPVIGIFRALLAVVGDWETSVAFLAHAAVPNFASLIKSDDDNIDKIQTAMNSAVLAACSLSKGVASDVCSWVGCSIVKMYDEMYPASNKASPKQDEDHLSLSPLDSTSSFVLAKDSTLAEMSSVLQAPLSALVKSGMVYLNKNLYIKLCRLYKHRLTSLSSSEDSFDVDDDTMSVLSTFLVPSLSIFKTEDTFLPDLLWSVLEILPYTLRYKLYSAWRYPGLEKGTLRSMMPASIRSGNIPKPLKIIESEIKTGLEARGVLKRISKENVKEKGPQLAKISHNNPLVVFTDILGKIESYDNMILMMVDTFHFVSKLGLDVMGYCLLVSLGGGGDAGQKNRTKTVGLNTEQWLSSLETFTGAFYKKFPDVELRGILIYITTRFKQGQSSELGVLRSLIKTVGGYGFVDYDSTAALSDLQLDGRCGSRLLKRETSSFGVVDDINRKASEQLRSVLQEGDLGVIILILLSKIRSKVLYSKESETVKQHVKVIGNQYDDCEAVMCLLLEYLSDSSFDTSAKEKFAASMPTLGDLNEKYGIDTSIAWMLCRPLVRKSMFYMDDSKLANKATSGEPPAYLKPFASSSTEMTSSYQSLLPEDAWKHITPTMFELFYSLAIYDLSCPEERYKLDIDRLKKDCERLVQLQKGGDAAKGQMSALAAKATAAGGSLEQIRQSTAFTQTHAAELARLKGNVDQLSKDFQRQQKRCKVVLSKLEDKKESLIHPPASEGGSINSPLFAPSFMTFCIYPRFLLSPEDALFCAHFIKLLHKMKVPGFLTIEVIDNIVNVVTGSLYCMTEDEAGNCSIFFNEIWKVANSWRYDNDAFASELKDTVRLVVLGILM